MAYSPASVLSSNSAAYPHLATVWYDTVAVENLKANLPNLAACTRRTLPLKSGPVDQLFTYQTLAGNAVEGSEGTVGTGIVAQSRVRQATIKQYFDFMSFSDKIVLTAIDPIVENHAAELGYRAALTVNTLVSAEFDVVGAVSGCSIDLSDNEFMSASVARQAVMSIQGMDGRPKADGFYAGIMHPFAAFDLTNDNTAGSVLDLLKHVESGQDRLRRGVQGYQILTLDGIRWISTTTVPTTPNYPSTGKTGYHSYVLGNDAVFAISLGNTGVPGEKNFRLTTKNYGDGDRADPAGVIGATSAYNFFFACIRRPVQASADSAATLPMRRIRGEASIS